MKYPEHTSTQFDIELQKISSSVLQMGELVITQLRLALEVIETGDLKAIEKVNETGIKVNEIELEIDECCTNLLVRRQPTANDLRLVKTIIKTINDLERIGDEAESISRVANLLIQNKSISLPCFRQIKFAANIAIGMLGNALDAFNEFDANAARSVRHKDSLIDEEFRSILRHLVAYMMEDTSELTLTLNAALVARSIERIGDHAKNISEYVIYMIEGRVIRNI